MYGFKGTNKDMKCIEFQYTLQTEYKHEGNLKACVSGSHLCKELKDVFDYYSPKEGNRFFVVKHGENYIIEGNKIVTDSITFVEEITPEFILNYNEKKIPDFDFLSQNLNSLLKWVSRNGYLEAVKFLISKGADIHTDNDYPLRWSSRSGHLEVVRYLVNLGADIHADDDYVLRWSSQSGQLEVVKYLVNVGANIHADNDCALRWSSARGHLEVVKYLVSVGADIHADDDYALRWASENNHLEVVKCLVSVGADIHCALRWSSAEGHLEVAEFLQSQLDKEI